MLARVCQRWRQIVLTSPLGLNLRLHCTFGTPVLKSLEYWPTLPIILRYGGVSNLDHPSPSDEDNIITALRHFGRVSAISLTVTSSLLEKLRSLSEPFSELEEICLLPQGDQLPTLPSIFRWGVRLRTLRLTRISFLSFPQLLSRSHGIVELKLCEIPIAGYFSPESFSDALSGVTQLETLSLHFLSLPPRRNYLQLPPQPGERVALPALTCLKYRGTSKYLDSFVARINTPCLGDIDITFFSQPTMDASQLGQFIGRIDVLQVQTYLSHADIETSAHAISICFTNSNTSATIKLQISCKQIDWQLSCMAQVCGQFSPFLFRVEELSIATTQSSSTQSDTASEQWLHLVRSFGGARELRVANKLIRDITRALGQVDIGETTLLPALRYLRVEHPMELTMKMNEPLWDPLLTFINLRSLSGRPIQVNVPSFQSGIGHAIFGHQKSLEYHKHECRKCSYCGGFQWTPRHNDQLFREHLESEHPEVPSSDALIWSTLLTRSFPSRLEGRSLSTAQFSPRAQHRRTVTPSGGSPMAIAPQSN